MTRAARAAEASSEALTRVENDVLRHIESVMDELRWIDVAVMGERAAGSLNLQVAVSRLSELLVERKLLRVHLKVYQAIVTEQVCQVPDRDGQPCHRALPCKLHA